MQHHTVFMGVHINDWSDSHWVKLMPQTGVTSLRVWALLVSHSGGAWAHLFVVKYDLSIVYVLNKQLFMRQVKTIFHQETAPEAALWEVTFAPRPLARPPASPAMWRCWLWWPWLPWPRSWGSGPAGLQSRFGDFASTVFRFCSWALWWWRECNQNFFFASFVGNCEIDLEIKRYFCRAGVQSIQVRFF